MVSGARGKNQTIGRIVITKGKGKMKANLYIMGQYQGEIEIGENSIVGQALKGDMIGMFGSLADLQEAIDSISKKPPKYEIGFTYAFSTMDGWDSSCVKRDEFDTLEDARGAIPEALSELKAEYNDNLSCWLKDVFIKSPDKSCEYYFQKGDPE